MHFRREFYRVGNLPEPRGAITGAHPCDVGDNASMNGPRNRIRYGILLSAVLSAGFFTTACSSRSLPKGAIGNLGQYNYSPTAIQTENTRQVWWCSPGTNPNDPSQSTDAIYYASVNMQTLEITSPKLVLAETPGSWDSALLCNPKVIGGVFQNPLGDGVTYEYAMYYVATAWMSGDENSIGVAFSNDGINWKKHPSPVIAATTSNSYAVGQPSVYNTDHKSSIYMLYEDSFPTEHHVAAISTDGVHFSIQGTVTEKGLDPDDPAGTWGDVAYDSDKGEWYAIFNRPLRPPSTTGDVIERGQYGVELYKIKQDALLTGSSPWQQLVNIDTSSTGFESNFIAGFVRGFYGDLNIASYPNIDMYTTVSYPPPSWDATPAEAGNSAVVEQWILWPMEWQPDSGAGIALNRYFNGSAHEVTTGWVSPDGNFQLQQLLGHLYPKPLNGATVPLYACKRGQADYFISLDVNCERQRILGKQGYAYAAPDPGRNLLALYRCSTGQDHFVSKDPKCEGAKMDTILGYVAP